MQIVVYQDQIEIQVLVERVHVPHISTGRFYLLCPWSSPGSERLISEEYLVGLQMKRNWSVTEVGKAVVDGSEGVECRLSWHYSPRSSGSFVAVEIEIQNVWVSVSLILKWKIVESEISRSFVN